MIGVAGLRLRMYLTLILVFAIGFAIIYAIMLYFGFGFIAIVAFALIFFAAQWYFSPSLMRIGMHLHYLEKGEREDIQRMVAQLAEQANVPTPRIAIAPVKDPNAFVFGRTVKSSTLVIHQGLLQMLNDDELKSVLAHEIGHLKHSDLVVMAVVAFIPALALIIAETFFFRSMFGGFGNRNSGSAIILVGIAAFFVYLISQLLVLSLSRARESYADMHSATTTGKPENLANALLKITAGNTNAHASQTPSSATARSLYIVDFFNARKDVAEMEAHIDDIKRLLPNVDVRGLIEEAKRSKGPKVSIVASMFSTHPSTYRRILDLAAIKKSM
ncbi:MAG: zinc metalloprotease HtpX [Candidatus Micrarchaeaceae archaeon]